MEHHYWFYTNNHFLNQFFSFCVGIFMAPGEFIYHSFASTPWGHEWASGAQWPVIALIALACWFVLFQLIGMIDDHVRGFVTRNGNKTLRRRRTDV